MQIKKTVNSSICKKHFIKECRHMINIFNKAVGWLRRDFYFTTQQVICIVIMILFIALLLRIACWWVEPVISRDGIRYIEWAEALKTANGDFDILAEQYTEYTQSPLFISILALPIPGMTPHTIALLLNISLGTLLVFIVFLLFKYTTNNNNIALAGALIAAVHPTLINYSIEIQRECGYLFCTSLFLLFFIIYFHNTKLIFSNIAAVAGVFAFLFRYEGWELFLFAGLAFAFVLFYNKSINRFRLVCHILLFGGTTILTILITLLILQKTPSSWINNNWIKLYDKISYQE